jgi:cytochrome c oxidase assembly protein subunit 15
MTGNSHDNAFARVAWLVLGYTLAVIVFGAWVRITGSGAGCGQHWPTCHGEIVHRPQSIETVIELTHRVTSGLSLLSAIGLLAWARKRFGQSHPATIASVVAVVFLVIEALLGAGLVAFGLVADDDSIARAVVMAIHLTNTCVLMGALAAAGWMGGPHGASRARPRLGGSISWLLGAALLAVLLVSMSGAVTALGDTLFPVAADGTVREHVAKDHSLTAHFLARMRIVHPILAVGVGLYLLWLAIALPGMPGVDADPMVRRLGNLVAGLVLAQLCAGVANIMLSAPGWMQLVHLALATCLWTAVVVLALAVLGVGQRNT